MKKNFLKILLVLFFVLFLSSCDNGINTETYIDLQGFVLEYPKVTQNNSDLEPISNARITINGKSTYSNSDGSYSISDLKAGKYYTIKVDKNNYINISYDIYVPYTNTSTFEDFFLRKREYFNGKISGNIGISSGYTSSSNPLSIDNNNNKYNYDKAPLPNNHLENQALQNKLNYVENQVLVSFYSDIEKEVIDNHIIGQVKNQTKNGLYLIESPQDISTEELYNYYQELDIVKIIDYNYTGYFAAIPNDRLFKDDSGNDLDLLWNLYSINLPLAWNRETGSNSVTVAVIDTGYISHDDLDANIGHEFDMINGDNDANDENAMNKDSSHGTAVAGIIGAKGNNGIGLSGINWNVDIMPIRISLDENNLSFSTDQLVDAIDYAVDHGANVINLSLAYNNSKIIESIEESLKDAYDSGVTVVASAGNGGSNTVYYPASSQHTIAVGASNLHNKLASYTNYGEKLDIIAPGGELTDINGNAYDKDNNNEFDGIVSLYNNDQYGWLAGTSMAAPHVSGVAALLYAQDITDPDEIRRRITKTATPIFNGYGVKAGLLNAHAAVYEDYYRNDYDKVRVLAGIMEEGNFYAMSTVSGLDDSQTYELDYVKNNQDLIVIGWIDENGDSAIGPGDYYGEYKYINLARSESRTGIDFNISYQNNSTLNSLQNIKGNSIPVKYNPPPSLLKKGD